MMAAVSDALIMIVKRLGFGVEICRSYWYILRMEKRVLPHFERVIELYTNTDSDRTS